MPVSKSKRKKKPRSQHSFKRTLDAAVVSDRRLLGQAMADELDTDKAIAELWRVGQGFTSERLDRAQEILSEMWDVADGDWPRVTARAFEACAWCGDAYGILATCAPDRSDLAVHLWRMAVAAAEFALKAELGDDVFEIHVGEFWLLGETRPYVRARIGLANALWEFGERDAAVEHDFELLRLNPDDNNGGRYVLAARLLRLGRDKELEALLLSYPEEDSVDMAFTQAAFSFRREGDSERSQQLLADAIRMNWYVPIYLLGRKSMPDELPALFEPGGEDEAILYAEMAGEAWRSIPGAMTWLSQRARYV